jgi:hypothetical protein
LKATDTCRIPYRTDLACRGTSKTATGPHLLLDPSVFIYTNQQASLVLVSCMPDTHSNVLRIHDLMKQFAIFIGADLSWQNGQQRCQVK